MGDQENVKRLEERSVPEELKIYGALSVAGTLGGFLIWKRTQSFIPFLALAATGALFDVDLAAHMRWESKMREQAERQREIKERGGQKNVKQLEERPRPVPEIFEPNWLLTPALALLGLPVSMQMRSLLPIFAFTAGGAIVDVTLSITRREIKMRYEREVLDPK